jgi:predicted nucleic acid-binding protein
MKIALDTNILAYATGIDGASKQKIVFNILVRLPKSEVILPAQVLGELFQVLVRKAKYSALEAQKEIIFWRATYATAETSAEVILDAAGLTAKHKLQVWDAVILAAAANADCRLLLSEDMQNGFHWNNITVADPFSARQHDLLRKALP